ncbi:DEKNAAC104610 [Brettanomyces naardenensis]|uniref:DEKNAAC104610 n=1 Tax=Brettanomyces naardenensis TaxID=13370 RepID=A0A448YQW2_BRENA|nr:DEKNAAC104610 [Brettanomyces naardenensis]
MALRINPISKIIGLSSVLAVGFLLVVLAAAVWGNWMPILITLIFLVAHIPTLLIGFQYYGYDESLGDFEDGGGKTDAADVGHFLESFFLTSANALALVLYHGHILTKQACVLTIIGGFLIYGTVVTFTTFFDGFETDDDDPFGM